MNLVRGLWRFAAGVVADWREFNAAVRKAEEQERRRHPAQVTYFRGRRRR